MVEGVSPETMNRRYAAYAEDLSYSAMSRACAAGLRPVRRRARRKNIGFTDRTGKTRKAIGPVRQYKPSTARRYRGGGAYFRGPGIVGAVLEYYYGRKYAFLEPSRRAASGEMLAAFTKAAERELDKAAAKARIRF